MAKSNDLELFAQMRDLAYKGGKGSVGQALYQAATIFSDEERNKNFIALHNTITDEIFIVVYSQNNHIIVVNIASGDEPSTTSKITKGDLPEIAKGFLGKSTEGLKTIDMEETIDLLKRFAKYDANPRQLRELAAYLKGK